MKNKLLHGWHPDTASVTPLVSALAVATCLAGEYRAETDGAGLAALMTDPYRCNDACESHPWNK